MKNFRFFNACVFFLIVVNPGEKECLHIKSGRRGCDYGEECDGATVGSPDNVTKPAGGAEGNRNRFTKGSTTRRVKSRTVPYRPSVEHPCDYSLLYCFKGYLTGALCARSMNFHYATFPDYCTMDYVNCKSRYLIWHVVYMGNCSKKYDTMNRLRLFYESSSVAFLSKIVMPEENLFGGDMYEGIG